jgi:ubiquinone/menaquinone biosynthesis C-methylase UbiE
MSERTRRAYDTWARSYDTDPNPHLVLEHDDVLALLSAQRGEYILDAACGTGRYTVDIQRSGAHVCGVDISEEMLSVARTKLPDVDFGRADLTEALPFRADTFDAIVCAQALKHLASLLVPVREFARVLKPGGRLVFSVTHPEMNWQGYDIS